VNSVVSFMCDLYCSATVSHNLVYNTYLIECIVLSMWICDYVIVFCFVSFSCCDLFHVWLLYDRTLDLGIVYVCMLCVVRKGLV
jgi:hypothetical protein